MRLGSWLVPATVFVLTLLECPATMAQLDDDVDGDGIPNDSDPFPLVAEVPEFTWTVQKMVLAWDVDLQWLSEQRTKSASSHLTASSSESVGDLRFG